MKNRMLLLEALKGIFIKEILRRTIFRSVTRTSVIQTEQHYNCRILDASTTEKRINESFDAGQSVAVVFLLSELQFTGQNWTQ